MPRIPNYSRKRIERMRKGLIRSWQPGGSHFERFLNRPADADTIRKRTLWDRRGTEITLPPLVIRHSLRRTDSYDVLINGKVVCSGGRVLVGEYLGRLLP